MEGGWGRAVSSGLKADSEIKEGRLSEQMEKQGPREARPFPGPRAGWGAGQAAPAVVILGWAFICHSSCSPSCHPVLHWGRQREPRVAGIHRLTCLLRISERSPSPSHLLFPHLPATSLCWEPMPLGTSRPWAWAGAGVVTPAFPSSQHWSVTFKGCCWAKQLAGPLWGTVWPQESEPQTWAYT